MAAGRPVGRAPLRWRPRADPRGPARRRGSTRRGPSALDGAAHLTLRGSARSSPRPPRRRASRTLGRPAPRASPTATATASSGRRSRARNGREATIRVEVLGNTPRPFRRRGLTIISVKVGDESRLAAGHLVQPALDRAEADTRNGPAADRLPGQARLPRLRIRDRLRRRERGRRWVDAASRCIRRPGASGPSGSASGSSRRWRWRPNLIEPLPAPLRARRGLGRGRRRGRTPSTSRIARRPTSRMARPPPRLRRAVPLPGGAGQPAQATRARGPAGAALGAAGRSGRPLDRLAARSSRPPTSSRPSTRSTPTSTPASRCSGC